MTARRGDAKIVVVYQKEDNNFIIKTVSDGGEILYNSLGYSISELVGQEFKNLVSDDIKNNINDFLEVEEDGGTNFISILRRTRNFMMRAKANIFVQLIMRIQLDVSLDGRPHYLIVLRNDSNTIGGVFQALNVISEYEVPDTQLGITMKEFFYKKADIVNEYIRQRGVVASIALIKVNKFSGITSLYGDGAALGVLQEIVARCSTSFRNVDILANFGGGLFAVILLESDKINARIPLSRLCSVISLQPMFYGENNNIKSSIDIAFTQMDGEAQTVELIERCSLALAEAKEDTGQLIEV